MTKSGQLAIRDLLIVTTIIAMWCGVLVISPGDGWFLSGIVVVCCLVILFRRVSLLFWLPLVFSSSLMLEVNRATVLAPRPYTIVVGFVVTFAIAVCTYTIRRTTTLIRRGGFGKAVVFASSHDGTISGLLVGLQFGLPILISGLATQNSAFPVRVETLLFMAIVFPVTVCTILGAMIGLVIGTVLCLWPPQTE